MLGKLSIIGAVAAILMIPTALSAQMGGAINPGVHVGTTPLTSSATNASQLSQRCTGRRPTGRARTPTESRKHEQWRARK